MTHEYLTSPCAETMTCASGRPAMCEHAVKEGPNGRFFVTMGHAAFNDRTNNVRGYASPGMARRAIAKRLGLYRGRR